MPSSPPTWPLKTSGENVRILGCLCYSGTQGGSSPHPLITGQCAECLCADVHILLCIAQVCVSVAALSKEDKSLVLALQAGLEPLLSL